MPDVPAATEATASDAAEFPSLPFEVVVLIVERLPARSIGAVGLGLCHEWAAAARSEHVWAAVVRRRWPDVSLDHFGARFGGWRHLFDTLLTVRPPCELSESDRHSLRDGALIELHALGAAARRFVQGVAQSGFVSRTLVEPSPPSLPSATCADTTRGLRTRSQVPTADGIFTYHEEGATPIHYVRRTRSHARGVHAALAGNQADGLALVCGRGTTKATTSCVPSRRRTCGLEEHGSGAPTESSGFPRVPCLSHVASSPSLESGSWSRRTRRSSAFWIVTPWCLSCAARLASRLVPMNTSGRI